MNRRDLVDTVAQETGLSTPQAEVALTAVLDGVVGAVAAGEKVSLPGFGTFEQRSRAARPGRNPQTGEALEIAATVAPAFKPAAAFKRAVADR